MRVSPCGWAVDLSRYTYRYRAYPVADDPSVSTTLRTFFTDAPFIPIPHIFTNPTFDLVKDVDVLPCVSHDWADHPIRRAPPYELMGHCAHWAGTDRQWLGEIYSTQPPLAVGPSGLPIACTCWAPYQPTLFYPFRLSIPWHGQRPRLRPVGGVRAFPFEPILPVAGEAPIAMLRPTLPTRPTRTYPTLLVIEPILPVAGEAPIAMLRPTLPTRPTRTYPTLLVIDEPSIHIVCGGDEGWYGDWTLTVTGWTTHPELNGTFVLEPLGWSGADFVWAMPSTIPVDPPDPGSMVYKIIYRGGTGCYRSDYGGTIGPTEVSGALVSFSPLTLQWDNVPAISGPDTIDMTAVATP